MLNPIFFQDHLFISSIEATIIPLVPYRNGILYNNNGEINRLLALLSLDYLYFYHIIFIPKTSYSSILYSSILYPLTYYIKLYS